MSDIPFEVDVELVYEDPVDWETVHGPIIVGKGRWTTTMRRVIHKDGRWFRLQWQEGNTEYQDGGYEAVAVTEVWPHQVMTTVYKDTPHEV